MNVCIGIIAAALPQIFACFPIISFVNLSCRQKAANGGVLLKKPIFILFLTAMLLALLLIGCGQKTRNGGDTPPAAIPADNPAGADSNQSADGNSKGDESIPQDSQTGAPENIPQSPEAGDKTGEDEAAEQGTDALLDSILEQLDSLDKLYSDLEEDNLTDSDLTD
jgi:hypothetical protein